MKGLFQCPPWAKSFCPSGRAACVHNSPGLRASAPSGRVWGKTCET